MRTGIGRCSPQIAASTRRTVEENRSSITGHERPQRTRKLANQSNCGSPVRVGIGTERNLIELVNPGASPPLPEGFLDGHGRDRFTEDDPSKFLPRARYQEIWGAQRRATLATLDGLSEADLDRTDERFPPFAPSVGAIMNLIGSHPLMHAGQFVAVRRKLGKPVAI